MNTNSLQQDHSVEVASPAAERAQRPQLVGIPLPGVYGVYALIGGQLTKLDPLPLRIPDPRVAVSAVISAPSRAHLPAGPLQIVVFRRDLAANAPDRVSLRVVAQVKRALSFDATGKPTIATVEQAWVVRNDSYAMTVAPMPGNPEMIIIRPDPAARELPAGRYALALRDGGYDFTIDGPNSDAAHCLERTDALEVPVYSECRNP